MKPTRSQASTRCRLAGMRLCSAEPQRGQAGVPTGATLPQVRQPARPASRAVRTRAGVRRGSAISTIRRGWSPRRRREDEAGHRPEGRAEVDGRHAADLHQRDDDADEEDLGHRPGPEVGGEAEGALGAAGGRAAEAERQERVAEGGGADERQDDDEQRGGGRERDDEAAGEGQGGVEQRGLAVEAGDRELEEGEEDRREHQDDAGEGPGQRAVDGVGAVGHQHGAGSAGSAAGRRPGTATSRWSMSQIGQAIRLPASARTEGRTGRVHRSRSRADRRGGEGEFARRNGRRRRRGRGGVSGAAGRRSAARRGGTRP